MCRAMAEATTIAVLAKAPVEGLAKTRLIALLGAHSAAALAARLIERTVALAAAAAPGRVTLWTAPDETHPAFQAMRAKFGVMLARQPDGDLGARMHQAIAAAGGPALVIGTDCPALTAGHLRAAAEALQSHDAVAIPAEDGGYVLIGLKRPAPALFSGMQWSVPTVMAETRRGLAALGLTCREFDPLWDVDTPADLARLRREHPGLCEAQQD
jgi:rSAM/selenodomain-associated transferase 1